LIPLSVNCHVLQAKYLIYKGNNNGLANRHLQPLGHRSVDANALKTKEESVPVFHRQLSFQFGFQFLVDCSNRRNP